MSDTKTCPFCAEEILAAAIKCKHCGEFLEAQTESAADRGSPLGQCPICGTPGGVGGFSVVGHLRRVHGKAEAEAYEMANARPPTLLRCRLCSYQPVSSHDAAIHESNAHRATGDIKRPHLGKTKSKKISQVGNRTDAGLACPKCGGTQFKVKRSGARKLGALAAAPITLGASAVIIAKGTQVKCVACATVYKRG